MMRMEHDGEEEDELASKIGEHKGSGSIPEDILAKKATTSLLRHLILDAKNISISMVRDLIAQKASVTEPDEKGQGSALIWALIKSASSKVVHELLAACDSDLGPDMIQNNNQKMTILMFAIVTACDHTVISEIVNRMVEMKVDIDKKDVDNNTALIYAARYGQKDVCELLLLNGADVNAVSNGFFGTKMTAMDYALNSDVQECLKKFGGLSHDSLFGPCVPRTSSMSSCCSLDRNPSGSSPRKRTRSDSPPRASAEAGSWWTCSCVRPREGSD